MTSPEQAFLPLQIALDSDSLVRCVYVKPQNLVDGQQAGSSSVFVAGLPFLLHLKASLETVFGSVGPVARVVVHPTQLSAVLSFQSAEVWEKLQHSSQTGSVLASPLPELDGALGLKGWVQEHQLAFPGNAKLRQQLDDWLAKHEEEEAAQKSAADGDDGWTVVRRKPGRRKTTDAAGTAVGAVASAAAEAQRNKKPPKVLHNFYKFQRRDQRRSEIMDLQDNFERDKRKIAELKAARRFKPY